MKPARWRPLALRDVDEAAAWYGAEGGRGFARLNFATSPDVLEEAVRRMASAL